MYFENRILIMYLQVCCEIEKFITSKVDQLNLYETYVLNVNIVFDEWKPRYY